MQIRKGRALAWQRYYDSAVAKHEEEIPTLDQLSSPGNSLSNSRLLEALMQRLIELEENQRRIGQTPRNTIPSDINVWLPHEPAEEQDKDEAVNKLDPKKVAERYRKMASLMANRPSYPRGLIH